MKRMTKAPSVPENLVGKVAAKATELMHELGFTNIIAVPAKRSVQWRIKFESEKRAANVAKRADKKFPDSFQVTKNVIIARIGGEDFYNRIMRGAYSEVGLVYEPSTPTEAKVKPVKAKKTTVAPVKAKSTRGTTPVTDEDLEKVLAQL
mgnify:CR=1 FL=1